MNRSWISDFGFRIPDRTRQRRASTNLARTGPARQIRNPQSASRKFRECRGGFSLLETVVAMAVTSVILLGAGSAMLIAARALPEAQNPAAESVAGIEALAPITTELQYAVALNQRSDRMIEFTVADRTGDGTPEVIRYEWSGAAGAPLARQYNGGAAVEVLSDVHEFSLSYDLQTISTEVPENNESAETLLVGYNSSWDYQDYTIRDTEWYGEYFFPVLPANTTAWKVTRVRFYAKQSGFVGGETRVQLQPGTTGGLPSGVVLEERWMDESWLPLLYVVQELTYTRVSGLSPKHGLCLVFRWSAGGEACKLLGRYRNVTAANIALGRSTDRGASWARLAGQSLLFSVYGTVTTAGTPQIQNTYYLNAIGVRLRTGTDAQATVQANVRIVNRPEVTQ